MRPDDEQLQKVPRPKQEIELSAIYWYQRSLPNEISLADTSIKVPHLGWGFTGLYGTRGRQEGFISARERAAREREQYTVIDVRVRLENPILQGRRTAANMGDQEILPLHQLVGSYAEELDDRVREEMHLAKAPDLWKNANSLLDTVAFHPGAARHLLALPEFAHVKILVHLAKTELSANLLPVATIRDEHMGVVVQAQCRLDPDLEVVLPQASKAPRNSRSEDRPVIAPAHRGPTRPR